MEKISEKVRSMLEREEKYLLEVKKTVDSVCVCLLPRKLGECFVSLLFELIAGKNASPSDKNLW